MQSTPVVVLTGVPGAGKTTIATRLRTDHGFTLLSRDSVKRALFGNDDVGDTQNDIAFGAMLQAVKLLSQLRRNVVVDGMPFDKEGQAEAIESALGPDGVTFFFVDTPIEEAMSRLSTPDPHGPADRTPELVMSIAKTFRPIPPSWQRIDGCDAASKNADFIASTVTDRDNS